MSHAGFAKRLWVDFNETHNDNTIATTLHNSYPMLMPELGEEVELYDEDGDECRAIVVEIRYPIVTCEIYWSTWQSPHRWIETTRGGAT